MEIVSQNRQNTLFENFQLPFDYKIINNEWNNESKNKKEINLNGKIKV